MLRFVLPFTTPENFHLLGTPDEPLQIVINKAYKGWKGEIALAEAFDVGTKLIPICIVKLTHDGTTITDVIEPLHRNRWGTVAMPLF